MPRVRSEQRLGELRAAADAQPESALYASNRRRMPGDQPVKLLVSYHYYKGTDLDSLARGLTTENGPPLMFADSGAFSAYTTGAVIDLEAYAAWIRKWQHLWGGNYVNLDVIGDAKATAVNQRKLQKMGLDPIPVVHGGTPYPYVRAICERHRYVALGGMVAADKTLLRRWLIGCFQIAEKTGTVFHGFGQTREDMIATLPWFSVDSTSWGSGFRFGTYPYWSPSTSSLRRCRAIATGKAGAKPIPDEARRQFRAAGIPVAAATDRRVPDHHLFTARTAAWAWWQMELYLRKLHGPIVMDPARAMPPGLHLYLVNGAPATLKAMVL